MHVLLALSYLTQDDIFYFHPFACKTQDVLLLNGWIVFHCVNESHFCIHSSVVGQLGYFQLLAITNKAIMNIVEHVDLWQGGASFEYIPKCGIAGSSGRPISNFQRNLHIDFQNGCTSLQSHQQWKSVPLSAHPHQHVLSPEVSILAILIDEKGNLRVVLICISLIIKDIEQFFRCFSEIQYSSIENSLFGSVLHF